MERKILVLLCLTGFAISDPILTIFGANPELFYFHNIESTGQMLLYALVVAFLPPFALWLIIIVMGYPFKRLGTALYLLSISILACLWLVQLLKWSFGLFIPGLLVLLGVTGGLLFMMAFLRWGAVESWLRLAAIVPFLVVGLFMYSSESGVAIARAAELEKVARVQRALPSIVFIMLDEFPTLGLLNENEVLDSRRFPSIAELAGESTWYRHYSVLHSATNISVPSILSGSIPRDVTPDLANYPNNLFSLMAPSHHLAVFESITALCGLETCSESAPGEVTQKPPPELEQLFAKTLSLWKRRISLSDTGGADLDDFEESFEQYQVGSGPSTPGANESTNFVEQLSERHVPKRLQRFLDALHPGKPTVYFLHIDLPHVPWRFYSSGKGYIMPIKKTGVENTNRDGGEWVARVKEYRFLMQAQHVDRLVGMIIERLKITNIWEKSLVILTADHGRTFRHNSKSREITERSMEGVAYAPLFVKRPHQKEGLIDDSNLMSYDVVPTIADILGMELPWASAGFAVGAPEIALRGDIKEAIHRGPKSSVGERKTYSDGDHFPKFQSRWIGAAPLEGESLKLLNESLGLDRFLERAPEEFSIRREGYAVIKKLSQLQKPLRVNVPLGAVIGSLDDKSVSGSVLVAVNGKIVTGSPLISYKGAENAFFAMLPAEALKQDNEIALFYVDGEELVAPTLSEDD
ncbi:MAG: hypothetical protein ACI9JM_001816 [Halioglobus sp.]|jgi:hypothetical protein